MKITINCPNQKYLAAIREKSKKRIENSVNKIEQYQKEIKETEIRIKEQELIKRTIQREIKNTENLIKETGLTGETIYGKNYQNQINKILKTTTEKISKEEKKKETNKMNVEKQKKLILEEEKKLKIAANARTNRNYVLFQYGISVETALDKSLEIDKGVLVGILSKYKEIIKDSSHPQNIEWKIIGDTLISEREKLRLLKQKETGENVKNE